jgi:hypothetical protein
MRKWTRNVAVSFLLGLAGASAFAQEPASEAKLANGFRSFIVRDERYPMKDEKNRTGRLHCLVCEGGLSPALAVFSRSIPKDGNGPLSQLATKQDGLTKQFAAQKLGAYIIFPILPKPFSEDDTRETRKDEVANYGRQLTAKAVPLGLAEANTPQVTGLKLDPADDITVIFYDRLKEIARWKFAADKGPTEDDLKAIDAAVAGHFKK